MKMQMKRDLNDHYLVLSDQETESLNSYQTRMLDENVISGLLSCHVEQIDDEIMLYYNVTSRQPLSEIVADRPVDISLLRLVLESLLETLHGIREFLLPPEGMILDPDCIFVDNLLDEVRFCYFPGREEQFAASLKKLSEFLLPKLNHDDREAVFLGYSFYQSCVNDILTEDTFARLLYGEHADDEEKGGTFAAGTKNESALTSQRTVAMNQECDREEPSEMEQSAERDARRQQILDDFFSDDDMEEEDPEMRKKIRFTIGAALAAAAIALCMIAAGRKDLGIGLGILLFAGIILMYRVRKKFGKKRRAILKSAAMNRRNRRMFRQGKENGDARMGSKKNARRTKMSTSKCRIIC
jgi:hypothetical protein